MAIIQADSPFPLFTDKGGDPLDGGFVYFGEPDLNPEESPKTVYYDAALAIATPQPLRTSNGYITRNGAPAAIYSDGDFSMTVRDRNNALVFYSPRTFLPIPDGVLLAANNLSDLSDAGAARINLGPWLNDVAALLANTSLDYDNTAAGDIIRTRAEGFAYEVAASGATDQHVTTAGGVKLYVLPAPDGSVTINQFGETDNATTGDSAVIRSALDYIDDYVAGTGNQGVLRFYGRLRPTEPIVTGRNVVLEGMGQNFRSQIVPLASFSGSCLFSIDGAENGGGFALRVKHKGFTVDCENIVNTAQLAAVWKIDTAYSIVLEDVFLLDAVGVGVDIDSANDVVLNRVKIYGRGTGDSDHCILVRSGGTGSEAGGGVKIISCDVENSFRGIEARADASVDVIASYGERCIQQWRANNTTGGHFTVVGGQWTSPGVSGEGARIEPDAQNVTVIGGTYRANGGHTVFVTDGVAPKNLRYIGVDAPSPRDPRNRLTQDLGDTARWYTTRARSQKDVTDNTATGFFTVTVPNASANFGVVDVTVNARDNSGYSLWTGKYRFAVQNNDGTLRATTIVEYAQTNQNFSASNFNLSVTCANSISGNVLTFEITADSGGTVGNGQSPRVSAEAELVQWDEDGPVYLAAI